MARYRPVQTIIWSDEDFLAMSDDAQLVWLHIFTNPLSNPLGIFKATVPGLAAEKGWPLERYTKGLQEGLPKRLGERLTKGLIDVDFSRHVVRFPNYFKHNKPDNPNVLKGWLKSWDEVPNCDLKIQHQAALYQACKRWGKPYLNVLETFGITLPETLPQTFPKQEREREQEREQERDSKNIMSSTLDAECENIFSFWCKTMGKDKAAFSKDRKRKVLDRLKEGYSVDEIKQAIVNCSNTPHNMGHNENRKFYNDLELICRSPEKLEQFRDNPGTLNLSNHNQQNAAAFKRFMETPDCE